MHCPSRLHILCQNTVHILSYYISILPWQTIWEETKIIKKPETYDQNIFHLYTNVQSDPKEVTVKKMTNLYMSRGSCLGCKIFQPRTFQPQASTPKFSTRDISTINYLNMNFFYLELFNPPLFNHEFFNSWIFEPRGLKSPARNVLSLVGCRTFELQFKIHGWKVHGGRVCGWKVLLWSVWLK